MSDIAATYAGSCSPCGRTWRSEAQAHCALCHHHFTSDSAFDRHVGKLGCSDPSRLRDESGRHIFQRVDLAGGPAWALSDSRPNPFSGSGVEIRNRETDPEGMPGPGHPNPAETIEHSS